MEVIEDILYDTKNDKNITKIINNFIGDEDENYLLKCEMCGDENVNYFNNFIIVSDDVFCSNCVLENKNNNRYHEYIIIAYDDDFNYVKINKKLLEQNLDKYSFELMDYEENICSDCGNNFTTCYYCAEIICAECHTNTKEYLCYDCEDYENYNQ